MRPRSERQQPCVACIDESLRAGYFYLVVLIMRVDVAASLDRVMRELCLAGQGRIHLKSERPRRRRLAISKIISISGIEAWSYVARRPAAAARRKCIEAVARDLADVNVDRLVIERVEDVQDHRDRLVIAEVQRATGKSYTYWHDSPSKHPGLQAADVIVWSYGAGGDWRARVMPIITRVQTLDS